MLRKDKSLMEWECRSRYICKEDLGVNKPEKSQFQEGSSSVASAWRKVTCRLL